MGSDPEVDSSAPIDQQITHLFALTNLIRELFQKGNLTLPSNLFEQLEDFIAAYSDLNQRAIQLEQHNLRLQGLVDIGQVLNSSLELNDILRIAMDTIIQLTRAERGFLMMRNNSGDLVIQVARNWEKKSIPQEDYAISRTIIRRVVSEGKPVLTTNAQEDPRFGGQESILLHHLRSILCVPIRHDNQVIGIIYTDHRIRTSVFGGSELDLLYAFSNQVAVAIENARLFRSLKHSLVEVTRLKNLTDNVFASIASGVITIDNKDIVTMCNRAAEQILGVSHIDMVGTNLNELFAAGNLNIFDYIATVWKTERSLIGIELNLTLPEKGAVALLANLSPLKDSRQNIHGVAIVLDDITEWKKLEAKRRLLERMVSPAVIEQLDLEQLKLGGVRTVITTLFADIRGFTHFSEHIAPEELVAILNRYMAVATNSILTYQGTIDKFQGDAVMAWFNAPIIQEDHTLRAVRAAIEIQKATCSLIESLPPELRLSYGIGIHVGDAVLGLVGTEIRSDYTAIGDSINTAKRIQEHASPGQVLISSQAYQLVGEKVEARPFGTIQLKGKSQPVQVFEVNALS